MQDHDATSHNLRMARWLTCLMFFTFAMTTDAVGSVIPRLISEYGLSMTAAGSFQYATMLGIAIGALMLGFLADRIGRRRTIILGLLLYGGSSLLVAANGQFPVLVALLALSGLGIGDITTSSQAHTRLMNTVEGYFALGAIVGPALVALLVRAGMSWKWLYVIAAAICLVLVFMASRLRNTVPVSRVEKASFAQMLKVARDPLALMFSLLIAFYVAVEVAIYTWMPTYLESYNGSFTWLPAWALTIFFVLRAVGRFVGAWLLDRLRWTVALMVLGALIAASFVGALLGGREYGVWLLPLSGLFMSIIYPTLNSKAISCFAQHQQGAAAGVILFFTAVAAAAGPLAMAAVSDARHDARAGFALATVFAVLLFLGLTVNWLRDPARRRLAQADAAHAV
jgi:MFS transporter, DHA1 family, quinolone resistance protein